MSKDSSIKFCVVYIYLMNIMATQTTYKPLVMVHGVFSGTTEMGFMKSFIEKVHPGTKVTIFDRFNGIRSLENAWHQVHDLLKDFKRICEENPNGIHLLGYSQGALIARALLEVYPEHTVKSFISLSGPQAGQFGLDFAVDWFEKIFPVKYVLKEAYQVFYSKTGQKNVIANYWRDPTKLDLYFKHNEFLPYINNEIMTKDSTNYRNGIIKLDRMVLIGGPDDHVITPWRSAHFEFYDEMMYIRPLKYRDMYVQDSIGLRELDENGKLIMHTRSNISHHKWHHDKDVINDFILPYLN